LPSGPYKQVLEDQQESLGGFHWHHPGQRSHPWSNTARQFRWSLSLTVEWSSRPLGTMSA